MASQNSRTETLDYIQTMLRELYTLAQAERYDILAYMIEMSYIECSDVLRGERPGRLTGKKDTKLGDLPISIRRHLS
ncbi:hypothetical protein B7H23_13705 [Notoacmeibacter marinus]|uniref:Uncharacterized protein n=1 Tax=Notoacmeibacter marinus TaxID=1876515 RepID=A0A231UVC1_9HYPH|nr:hypothetical protein [Notoacmeibacter marinus]OXS99235.1 hypothetical protein B7H23_13705 [Notoacmeibacter marinus]